MAPQRQIQGEQYIICESPEINVGWIGGWKRGIARVFPAFRSRNYRLYFAGQLISLIGTWLQMVAQGWLVWQLTGSALAVGSVAAVAGLPMFLFSFFGGMAADRFDKRKILFFTQASAMVLALALGGLTVTDRISVPAIAFLAFLLGVVHAIDSPARQAFVVELVGKKYLQSAIALNSGIFNGARVIGPSIAGFVIYFAGTGGAFLMNGVSYLAVLAALLFIKTKSNLPEVHPHPMRAIQQGLFYAWTHPVIKTLLFLTAVTSIFGWSYATMLPVIAAGTFGLNAQGLGFLYSAAGLGALAAMVLVSAFSAKIHPSVFIFGGNALFAAGIFLFTLAAHLPLALFFLFIAGLGLLAQFSTINGTIQHLVSDNFRGRIMSLYTFMFIGLMPLGNAEIGYLSERFGTAHAIQINTAIVLLLGLLVFLKAKNVNLRQ